jgi:hypothetical protein
MSGWPPSSRPQRAARNCAGGHASAATAFERAARLSETESTRGRRLADAARAAYVAGQVERASELVSQSLPIADRAERAGLLGLRGVIDGYAGLLPDAVRTLLDVIALSEDVSLSLEMLLEGCAMTSYLADYEQLSALCVRASELSAVTDTDRFIVTLMAGAGAELDGDYAGAAELTARAVEIAERLDDARCLIWCRPPPPARATGETVCSTPTGRCASRASERSCRRCPTR